MGDPSSNENFVVHRLWALWFPITVAARIPSVPCTRIALPFSDLQTSRTFVGGSEILTVQILDPFSIQFSFATPMPNRPKSSVHKTPREAASRLVREEVELSFVRNFQPDARERKCTEAPFRKHFTKSKSCGTQRDTKTSDIRDPCSAERNRRRSACTNHIHLWKEP